MDLTTIGGKPDAKIHDLDSVQAFLKWIAAAVDIEGAGERSAWANWPFIRKGSDPHFRDANFGEKLGAYCRFASLAQPVFRDPSVGRIPPSTEKTARRPSLMYWDDASMGGGHTKDHDCSLPIFHRHWK